MKAQKRQAAKDKQALINMEQHGKTPDGKQVPVSQIIKQTRNVIKEYEIIDVENKQIDYSKLIIDDELRPPNPEIGILDTVVYKDKDIFKPERKLRDELRKVKRGGNIRVKDEKTNVKAPAVKPVAPAAKQAAPKQAAKPTPAPAAKPDNLSKTP